MNSIPRYATNNELRERLDRLTAALRAAIKAAHEKQLQLKCRCTFGYKCYYCTLMDELDYSMTCLDETIPQELHDFLSSPKTTEDDI